MNWFGYKNISKLIMTTTILIILANTLLISLFYYQNQLQEHEENFELLKEKNLNKQIEGLKTSISNIIAMIEYKYTKEQLQSPFVKEEITTWLNTIEFNKQKSDYIFVYELLDEQNKDNFAKMIMNPNRPDLVGRFISINYKDKNGYNFRKKILDDINKYGQSTVTYVYKKTSNKIEEKVTYAQYYQDLNWIFAKGVYKDDIKKEMLIKGDVLKEKVIRSIQKNILVFIIFLFIAIIITYFISKKIQNIILEKDKKVEKSRKDLDNLNRELDNRVTIQIEKTKEQEQLLMQKSKFIALGETISLIAHQWRQPLNELGVIILNVKLHHKLGKLDINMMNKKTNEVENLLLFMSKTIDDFRTFFKPNKIKSNFNLSDSMQKVLLITKAMLEYNNIKTILNIDSSLQISSYQNEFEQVIINLISNAKDAMIHDNILNPILTINIYKKEKITIEISDNAKGIDKKVISKIFDPYFTTKDDANGTGIGLYISKVIIEKNMLGKLNVFSSQKGSTFKISFNEGHQ